MDIEPEVETLKRDLESLERAAAEAAEVGVERLAVRVGAYVLVLAVLAVLAWLVGRKVQNRGNGTR
ncbi:MAG: hypothetical protein U0V73_10535 [Acidimicrobiia bacterium]